MLLDYRCSFLLVLLSFTGEYRCLLQVSFLVVSLSFNWVIFGSIGVFLQVSFFWSITVFIQMSFLEVSLSLFSSIAVFLIYSVSFGSIAIFLQMSFVVVLLSFYMCSFTCVLFGSIAVFLQGPFWLYCCLFKCVLFGRIAVSL